MTLTKLKWFLTLGVLIVNCSSCHKTVVPPSQVEPTLSDWSILLGDGTKTENLTGFNKDGYFYSALDNNEAWIVFKTPNAGTTSRTSSNTRTELGELDKWHPMDFAELKTNVKVKHTSVTGDCRVPASFSVVIGQIHSIDGHENEPLKIFYKKFPGHQLGSVFWNYEINTLGSNEGRWDFSTAVWGYDMSVVGNEAEVPPKEPISGIALGETFTYSITVENGVMTLVFNAEHLPTRVFTKSLISSSFTDSSTVPNQVKQLYEPLRPVRLERKSAYSGEAQIFKLGAYNQSNGKSPESNSVWHTNAHTKNGDISKQYQSGNYAEIWFRDISLKHSK